MIRVSTLIGDAMVVNKTINGLGIDSREHTCNVYPDISFYLVEQSIVDNSRVITVKTTVIPIINNNRNQP